MMIILIITLFVAQETGDFLLCNVFPSIQEVLLNLVNNFVEPNNQMDHIDEADDYDDDNDGICFLTPGPPSQVLAIPQ